MTSSTEKLPTEVIRVYLGSLLFLEPKLIISTLFSKRVITLAEKNIVSGVSLSSVDQMDKLLHLLLTKLENFEKSNDRRSYMGVFEVFVKALTDSLHQELAARLMKYQQSGHSEGTATLSQVRSNIGAFEMKSIDFFVTSDETDSADYHFIDAAHMNMFHYYPIKLSSADQKLGFVLIIDIRDYSGLLGVSRTSRDCDLLTSTFEKLNYKVNVETNLTASNFASVIEDQLKKCELGKFSSFILFVLAFGDETDLVCGVDGQTVSLNHIRRKVQDCPHLFGCPKLFFFLSSRGSRPEPKVTISEASGIPSGTSDVMGPEGDDTPLSAENISQPKEESRRVAGGLHPNGVGSCRDRGDTVPRSADTFVCYACQRNFTVFGLKDKGSWFANILCGIVSQRSHQLHLMDIITEVSYYMSSMKISASKSDQVRYGQLPEVICSLRKRFYFVFPNM